MILTLLIAVPVLLYVLIPMPKRTRYVLAAALVFGLYLLFWPSTYRSYRLEKDGLHTAGIVLRKNCGVKSSQTVWYKFRADGHEFEGKGKPLGGARSCEAIQIGDQIFITYLGSDPNISTPEREATSHIFIGALFSIGVFGWLVWANGEQARFLAEKRKRKAKNA